jgi:hypothetical protein
VGEFELEVRLVQRRRELLLVHAHDVVGRPEHHRFDAGVPGGREVVDDRSTTAAVGTSYEDVHVAVVRPGS